MHLQVPKTILAGCIIAILSFTTLAAQITITGEPVICNGNPTILTAYAESAVQYTWSNGASTNSINLTHAGTYTVTATDSNGNTASSDIVVRDSKEIENLQFNLCPGFTTQVYPFMPYGTWTSNNPDIATISQIGLITPIASGTTTFLFHYDQSTCVAETKECNVFAKPAISASKDGVCSGGSVQLSPSTGGTWSSLDNNIATVNNAGLVTAIKPGKPHFSFTSSETNCSNTLNHIVVHETPEVEITGKDTICYAHITTLKPNTGGSWSSTHPLVGSITNSGVVTGVGYGSCAFTFRQTSTGCVSKPSQSVYVVPRPKIQTDVPRILCTGGDKQQIITEKSGAWSSSNVTIATITHEGVIYPVASGTVYFTHSSPSYACYAEPMEFKFQSVNPAVSSVKLFQNSFTDLRADASGSWNSLQQNILKISGNKKAISYNQGKTKLEFVSDSGCYASFAIEVQSKKPGYNTDMALGSFKADGLSGFTNQYTETRIDKNDSNSLFGNIGIYPNPVSEKLNITPGNYQMLRIHNISGKLMCEIDYKEREVYIQHWPAGVYNATFYNGQERITKFFVKM